MRTRSIVNVAALLVAAGMLLLVSGGTASGTGRVPSSRLSPRIMTCAGKVVYEPSAYVISCADANSELVGVHWSWWTPNGATALATYSANDCTPNCAAGKFHNYPAAASFWAPKRTKYGLLYSRLRVVYKVGVKIRSFETTLPLRGL